SSEPPSESSGGEDNWDFGTVKPVPAKPATTTSASPLPPLPAPRAPPGPSRGYSSDASETTDLTPPSSGQYRQRAASAIPTPAYGGDLPAPAKPAAHGAHPMSNPPSPRAHPHNRPSTPSGLERPGYRSNQPPAGRETSSPLPSGPGAHRPLSMPPTKTAAPGISRAKEATPLPATPSTPTRPTGSVPPIDRTTSFGNTRSNGPTGPPPPPASTKPALSSSPSAIKAPVPSKLPSTEFKNNLFISNYLRRGSPSNDSSSETAEPAAREPPRPIQTAHPVPAASPAPPAGPGFRGPGSGASSPAPPASPSGNREFTPQLRRVTNPIGMQALPTKTGTSPTPSRLPHPPKSTGGGGPGSPTTAKPISAVTPVNASSSGSPSAASFQPRTAHGSGFGGMGGPTPGNVAGVPGSPSSNRVTFTFTSPHTTHRQVIDPVIRQMQLRTPHLPARNALKTLGEAFHRVEMEIPGIAEKLLQAWIDASREVRAPGVSRPQTPR
ncbi:hypothetical protein IWQ60_009881, partial [Tieghemiomyces parasiticus]